MHTTKLDFKSKNQKCNLNFWNYFWFWFTLIFESWINSEGLLFFCLSYALYFQNFTVKRLRYNRASFLADEHENIFSHLTHTYAQGADIRYTTVTSSVGVMEVCRQSGGQTWENEEQKRSTLKQCCVSADGGNADIYCHL